MTGTLLTLWSIRLASICFAVVILEKCRRGVLFSQASNAQERYGSLRLLWTAGCVLALLHLVFAFTFYHHWSHAEAVSDTAAKTKALLGISFGGGVWFNYLFFVVWMIDSIYWWVSPGGYAARSNTIRRIIYAYLGFIMFNGVVVFATGYTRLAGTVFCVLLAAVHLFQLKKSKSHRHKSSDESGA